MKTLLATIAYLSLSTLIASAQDPEPDRWQEAMDQFATEDTKRGDEPVDIVFTGSSSIRLWDLAKSFPDLKPAPLNRGFGGSQYADIVRHIDRLVLRHKPRLVVLYSGDNDMAAGKKPEDVHGDFLEVVTTIRKQLPETRILVLAAKPSEARWKLRETYQATNKLIAATCQEDEQLMFIDTWPPLLGDDGEPDATLFRDDQLHLNDAGYVKWNELIGPLLELPKKI
jgi:lysophospholipase L1-like esterase